MVMVIDIVFVFVFVFVLVLVLGLAFVLFPITVISEWHKLNDRVAVLQA